MPNKPKRICGAAGCYELTPDSYCPLHQEERQQRERQRIKQTSKDKPSYSKWYSLPRWRTLRLMFLRLNPLCVQCHERGRLVPASVVDHIISHKGNVNLFWDVNNFQSLCKRCHDVKTASEDGGFGNTKK
jgi:5-methylcytosine-specific restriction protein A